MDLWHYIDDYALNNTRDEFELDGNADTETMILKAKSTSQSWPVIKQICHLLC